MSTSRTRPDAGWSSGKRLEACRYCGGPLPTGKRSFCGGARTTHRWEGQGINRRRVVDVPGHGCVHEWCLRTMPAYARAEVLRRDGGVCATCGIQCGGAGQPAWQADHIVPVVEGGGECGLENLRTLCTSCHRGETAALARRRAAERRAAKQPVLPSSGVQALAGARNEAVER